MTRSNLGKPTRFPCVGALLCVVLVGLAGGCVSTNVGAVVGWHSPAGVDPLEPGAVLDSTIPAEGFLCFYRLGLTYIDTGAVGDVLAAHVELDTGYAAAAWASGPTPSGYSSFRLIAGGWWSVGQADDSGPFLSARLGWIWDGRPPAVYRLDYGLVYLGGLGDGGALGHAITAGLFW